MKEEITADEFLDLVDELCWKYGFEIIPARSVDDKPFLSVQQWKNGSDSARVWYIDGDGRGK